jgi:hypothetical protein
MKMFNETELFEAMMKGGVVKKTLQEPQKQEPKKLDERRLGIPTASGIWAIMTNGRGKDTMGATALAYAQDMAIGLLTGISPHVPTTYAMQWGIDHELEAIARFEADKGLIISAIGDNQRFILSDNGLFGGTPDGLIFDHEKIVGGLEVKCPNSKTHLGYRAVSDAQTLKSAKPEYYWQCQTLMALTDTGSWHFMSYDPRFTNKAPQFVAHYAEIERNDNDIAMLINRVYEAKKIRDRIIETGVIE